MSIIIELSSNCDTIDEYKEVIKNINKIEEKCFYLDENTVILPNKSYIFGKIIKT